MCLYFISYEFNFDFVGLYMLFFTARETGNTLRGLAIYLTGPYLPGLWRPNRFFKFDLEGREKKAGQIKGRPKFDQLKFFAENNWTCSIVWIQLR